MANLPKVPKPRLSIDPAAQKLETNQTSPFSLGAHLLCREDRILRAIAREVHDKAGQQIAVVGYELDELASKGKSKGTKDAQLAALHKHLDDLAETLRVIERRLYPSLLTDLGLSAALRSLAAKQGETQAEPIKIRIAEVSENLPLTLTLACYRITSEALQNAAQYAPDGPVELALVLHDHALVITVKDSGKGFDLEEVNAKGAAGLLMMHTRAHSINARLQIESTSNGGTLVCLTVPLEFPAQASK